MYLKFIIKLIMNYNYWIYDDNYWIYDDNYWIYKDKFIFKPNFNKPITNYIEIIKDYKILTFENYIDLKIIGIK
jgi:hypothetical protein